MFSPTILNDIESEGIKIRSFRNRWLIFLFILLNITNVYAWNALGHELVAQMALSQLTPAEIKRLEAYNTAFNMGYQPKRLSQAAAWLDWLHCQEEPCRNFRYYHYIDYPYVLDGVKAAAPREINALTAVNHAFDVLHRKAYHDAEKGLQLRILMHVVADLHQPMHAVSLYSGEFPEGDKGGNRFSLGGNRVANNLHAYWDRGAGFLVNHGRRHPRTLKRKAAVILRHYPCVIEKVSLNPAIWANESFQLAKVQAYTLHPHDKPSRDYQLQTRRTSEARLALAGCRLGAMLKDLA